MGIRGDGMIYDVEGNALFSVFDVDGEPLVQCYDVDGTAIEVDIPAFLDTAVLTALPNVYIGGVAQGSCTDGEYLYQCVGDSTHYTYMQIVKYKISDGTYTIQRYEGTPNFGHANDMAYNPNNGYLYIATMLSNGAVVVIDATDMTYVDTIYAKNGLDEPYAVWQICFNRDTDEFLSAYNNDYYVYDQNWDLKRIISADARISATQQGCDTDGKFIYRVTYNPNRIDVVTMRGDKVKVITNPMSNEPEDIMYDWDGHFYMSKHTSSAETSRTLFYATQLFET